MSWDDVDVCRPFVLNGLQGGSRVVGTLCHDHVAGPHVKERPEVGPSTDMKERHDHDVYVSGLDPDRQHLCPGFLQFAAVGVDRAPGPACRPARVKDDEWVTLFYLE